MPRKKKNIPSNETPEQRFIRLASDKTNSILKALKTMSNLRGTRGKSTPAQREAISKAITDALKKSLESMAGVETESTAFKL